ncbi:MAG: phospholipid scramblase-related protein [Myxococcota bacterium]
MSDLFGIVQRSSEIMVVQRRELAELFGFETRNKYALEVNGTPIGFAAEQGKGGLAFLARMFLGHWRTFEIHVFDNARHLILRVVHPFRFFFQRLEVSAVDGRPLGAIQQRFAFFSKRFDVTDAAGNLRLTVSSPLWRPWSFAFERDGNVQARVEKKWSGLLREAFTDTDRFRVAFESAALSPDDRALVLAAAIFIDLQYFEQKAD